MSMAGFDLSAVTAFFQVVLIDLTLAGDNAIVVGLVAARLRPEDRRRAVLLGVIAATVMRIGFAICATYFLHVIGLTLAGGLLLLWVVWKLFRELRAAHHGAASGSGAGGFLTPLQAMGRIVIADLSMSLDNVLAVAGTARDHLLVLIAGLSLSVALMGLGSTLVVGLMHRAPWIAYVGLAIIAWVSVEMIWAGSYEVWPLLRDRLRV